MIFEALVFCGVGNSWVRTDVGVGPACFSKTLDGVGNSWVRTDMVGAGPACFSETLDGVGEQGVDKELSASANKLASLSFGPFCN